MASSTGPIWAASLHCPAVTRTDKGKPCPSAHRWILLVMPPRERPSHSSVTRGDIRDGTLTLHTFKAGHRTVLAVTK
jgi:hypothetical protein